MDIFLMQKNSVETVFSYTQFTGVITIGKGVTELSFSREGHLRAHNHLPARARRRCSCKLKPRETVGSPGAWERSFCRRGRGYIRGSSGGRRTHQRDPQRQEAFYSSFHLRGKGSALSRQIKRNVP